MRRETYDVSLPVQPATSDAFRPGDWSWAELLAVLVAGVVGAILFGLPAALFGQEATIVMTGIGQYTFFILAIWLVLRRHGQGFAALRLDVEPSDLVYMAFGVLLQIGLAALALPVWRLAGVEGPPQELSGVLAGLESPAAKAVMALTVVGLGPLTEELLFRGMLLRMLERRYTATAAIVGSSAVFAAFHLVGVARGQVLGAAVVLVTTFLVGLILGRMAIRRGRLGPGIFTHAGFNLLALGVLYAAPQLTGVGP
jgi:membrane protease YdiL (CAAX protease family)